MPEFFLAIGILALLMAGGLLAGPHVAQLLFGDDCTGKQRGIVTVALALSPVAAVVVATNWPRGRRDRPTDGE